MNRNNLWRFLLIIAVVAWSIYEMYPPKAQDLVQYFRDHAERRDATFNSIYQRARELQKEHPDRNFQNLEMAIGTNDITPYFPQYEAKNEEHPTTKILNGLQRDSAGKIHLGIDLQGGMSFLVEMDTNKLESVDVRTNTATGKLESVTNHVDVSGALSQAIDVLRRRVDRFGVAEPVIQPEGNNRILIQLPGLSEAAMRDAIDTIQRPAYLEFRMVHEDSKNLEAQGISIPGYEWLTEVRTAPNGQKTVEKSLVKKKPEMIGGIKSAIVIRGNLGEPKIAFTLDSASTELFGTITKNNIGRQLAIVLDGKLQTAPTIQSAIETGSGEITGNYSQEEAFQLANVLENPLKAPVHIVNSSEVDPTLGNDTIHSGIKACIIGVVAVAAFMIVYYAFAGAIADVALLCNIVILLGVMCSVGTTLTLPGIAGIVLTVGMAVDANVLIFERIREESAKGKSLRGALNAGYDRAFGTIFDSHVTTLISSIILIFMGTGSVKGFGVSLTIGVAASLFTALVITRLIFDWLIGKNIVKSLPMLHLIPGTMKINFMRLAIPAFIASWTLIAVGTSYGIYRGMVKHDLAGVEFTGGEIITLRVDQAHKPSVDKIREVATKTTGSEVLVAYQHDISTGADTLRVTARDTGKSTNQVVGEKVFASLKQAFPEANFGDRAIAIDRVGPTVGEEITQAAILASLLAMFGILVYVAFRYEFTFAVGAVIAIIHDVLMTLGCYFLAGRELNATTVAAVLTIIGFSINDTIVIFDRIREDLKLGVRGSFKEVINQALNQTLSRTIITSGTVFLATMSLYIFGGGPINDFAFTFLVGIITGTYSSIYIASAYVLFWQNWRHNGQRPKIGSGQVAVDTNVTAQ